MFFKSVEFREVQHLAFSDEYITAYVSVNNVPKIHMSVNTPRDEYGLAKGKPKRYFRMGGWKMAHRTSVCEEIF